MSERLTTFLKTITDFADEECRELEESAQSRKEESISKYKKKAQAQSESYTEHETSRILSRANKEISDYESEKKAALTMLRSSITDKVFNEVKEKINVFVSSEEYEDFLIRSAKSLSAAIKSERVTFSVRPADIKFSDAIKTAVPGCAVLEDSEIILGGLKCVNENSSICGDDTIDTRLALQRNSFAEKSDLKIY